MDAHLAALEKTVGFIDGQDVLEVTYKVPFGFHEIYNRENVSVSDFLLPTYQKMHSVCVLHILLGCGVSLEDMINVINKAIGLCDRVLVLEHNKESKDWDWDNKTLVEEHSLHNCLSYDEFSILRELYGWESFRSDVIVGERSPDRNFIVEIFGRMPTYDFKDKFEMVKRLHIPIFSDGVPFPNFCHLYDVYLGTAESQTQFLQNTQTPIITGNNTLYAVAGGFFSLNYIHFFRDLSLKEIVLFDINPYTLDLAKTVFELIKTYPTMTEFLTNYYLCNIISTPQYELSPTSWGDRVRLYLKNYYLYNETSTSIFQLILNGDPKPEGLWVYGMRNCASNRTDEPGILSLTSDKDNFVNENTLNVGKLGWLESEVTYQETRQVLLNQPITIKRTNIVDIQPNPEDILIGSNIFRGGFADRKDFNCTVLEG